MRAPDCIIYKGGQKRLLKTEGSVDVEVNGDRQYTTVKVAVRLAKLRLKFDLPFKLMDYLRWRLSGQQSMEYARDEEVRYYVEATRRDHDASDAHAVLLRENTRSQHMGKALGLITALQIVNTSGTYDHMHHPRAARAKLEDLVRLESEKQAAQADVQKHLFAAARETKS